MRCVTFLVLIAFVGIAVAPAGPIVPGGPPPPPVIRPAPQPQYNDVPFTDEAVEAAILKGIKYLMDRQKPDGSWDAYSGHPVGTVAAATYALFWPAAMSASTTGRTRR